MARYICILNNILIWFVTITMISCLPTRTKLQRVFLDDKTTLENFFISSELTLLPDRLGFIWISTQDKFLRKFNYPRKYRYGLEFNLKHKSLHLVMCILLAGDIATNPGPNTPNIQPTGNCSNKEFGPSIALANMMSLAPKIDELRCFVNNTKPDLISLTETWINDSVSEHHLKIPGFNLLLKNRTSGPHGGVGLYIKNSVMFKALTDLFHQ